LIECVAMPQTNPTVLIVDDEVDTLTLLGLAIKRLPWRLNVATAQDGEEAAAYLKGEGPFADRKLFPLPRLILLDLKMPKMDGFEFLQWLRKEPDFHLIPVVALTVSILDRDVWR